MRKIVMILAVLALSCAVSFADSITFSTPTGATTTGGDMASAQATVTTGAGVVMIQLWNTLGGTNSISNAGQLLSDFSVTLGSAPGSVSYPAGNTGTGSTFFINSGGVMTATTATTSLGWGLSASSNTISLNGLGGTNTPADLLVGLPCANGDSCNANGSIAANPGHNPFASNGAIFTINATGVTATTAINSAVFSFGTTAGDDIPGNVVPEPASLLLLGTGLLGLGLLVRRKSSHAA